MMLFTTKNLIKRLMTITHHTGIGRWEHGVFGGANDV
jgi:hypothetical protein